MNAVQELHDLNQQYYHVPHLSTTYIILFCMLLYVNKCCFVLKETDSSMDIDYDN